MKTNLHAARKKTKLTKLLIFKHAAPLERADLLDHSLNAVGKCRFPANLKLVTKPYYDVTCTDVRDSFLRFEGAVEGVCLASTP